MGVGVVVVVVVVVVVEVERCLFSVVSIVIEQKLFPNLYLRRR